MPNAPSSRLPRKEPEAPKTRSGRSKQAHHFRKHGDYEPILWTRVSDYAAVPILATRRTPTEQYKDPMGGVLRFHVRKHYQIVIYALDAVVTRQARELRDTLVAPGRAEDHALLVRAHEIGIRGATKLPSRRLMEKIQRAPKRWWLGLDSYAEHIAVLDQAGHETLVEWLRTYRP